MALYATVVTTLGIWALAAIALGLGLGAGLALPRGRKLVVRALVGRERHPIGWAWVTAVIAAAGSLYLSDVAHLVPCELCWYQRTAMYPLVFVLGVGLIGRDPGVWRFALPLSVAGLLVAAYHVTIQWQPTLDIEMCAEGVPCTARYVAVFGFVSIPTMASGAFLLITAVMFLLRALEREGATEYGAEA